MENQEIWERIAVTIDNPPCIIEFEKDRRSGSILSSGSMARWEHGVPWACIGVAVAMVGYDLDKSFVDRAVRAKMLGWEWSYLMHFEHSICRLFSNDIVGYNETAMKTGMFPRIRWQWLPMLDETNYSLLKPLLSCK